jgi:hypothetical protein
MLKSMLLVVAIVVVMMGGAATASADCTAAQASYTSTSIGQAQVQMIFGQWANARSTLTTLASQATAGNACWPGGSGGGMGSTVIDVTSTQNTLYVLLNLTYGVQNVASFISSYGSDPSSGALSQAIGLQLSTLYSLLSYVN